MEQDKKTQLLLDMQEHPEHFTAQALKAMLDDPEVHELAEATAVLKQAMTAADDDEADTCDVEAEWQHFAATHFPEEHTTRGWPKVAASIIGVLMVSGIAFAAIHLVRGMQEPTVIQTAGTTAVRDSSPAARRPSIPEDTIPSRVIRYEEATLEQILTDMAAYYGLTLRWKNDEAKRLRLFYTWNQQLSATEAVSSMNSFERIRLELSDSILTADVQTSSQK